MHTELTRRLQVQPGTITKMLQRMEKTGFVERRQQVGVHCLDRQGCDVQSRLGSR